MKAELALLVAQLRAAADRRGDVSAGALGPLLAVLEQEHPAVAEPEANQRLAALARVFGLGGVATAILVAALAADLDANIAAAYAVLQGDARNRRLRAGLALELSGAGSLDVAGRAQLLAGGPLLRHHLVEDVAAELPFLDRPIAVPDRVTAHLLGDDGFPPVVRACLAEAVPLASETADLLGRALSGGAPLVWVREQPGASGLGLAAAACDEAGVAHLAIDMTHVGAPLAPLLSSAVLEAGLRGCVLLVQGADAVAAEDPALLRVLADAAIPVIACARRAWHPGWPVDLPVTTEAAPLANEQRAALWLEVLRVAGPVEVDAESPAWRDLVSLRLSPEDILRVSGAAVDAVAAAETPLTIDSFRVAARRLAGSGVTGTATVGAVASFDDLVLPPQTMTSLTDIIDWARHRDEVLAQGPVAGAGGKGRGISALFTGGPGTGKSLAAQVVAGALGLDLQTVDLPAVVDKYIGETEKNLERIFVEAEALNVVLFFDEADALFGSRSEVKDARDRYANQEVAYLLQRMEVFNGIAILASNLRGNFDAAFNRRLQFIVHFPDPDVPTRERLWERHLAALSGTDPHDPVDIRGLAKTAEVSGGEIRNIVLAAAYAAASAGAPVGHRTVAAATAREYAKLGRRVPEAGFGRS